MENKLRQGIQLKKTFLIEKLTKKHETKTDEQQLDKLTLTELEREYRHQLGK
ncbi:Fur-regulated basic protein FbpA [Bacillus marinisedimentorum]|uniref:Fur-regulated basic protein FbpA n=1 Tax=Bacillus marinisedimentorum TaxID=1821260 RepID=UPI0009F34404|nr:Fur-regulated basic protein FbpA [Bacillus marinisedimentorum]